MPHDVLAVANYFLDRADADGVPLDHLKLQALTYLAHGWHLGLTGEPLIYQRVEAWPDGPIIPDLFQRFADAGGRPIRDRALTLDFDTWDPIPYPLDRDGPDETAREVMDRVWGWYGQADPLRLSALNKLPGSPFDAIARRSPDGRPRGEIIPADLLRDHYARRAAQLELSDAK